MSHGQKAHSTRSRIQIWVRRFLRLSLVLLCLVATYFLAALGGALIPVNGDYEPAENGVTVYARSNGVHIDLWVPIHTEEMDWSEWIPDPRFQRDYGYVGFGWGDRNFLLETPTWDDLTLGNAAYGLLWPSPSLMRTTYVSSSPRTRRHGAHVLELTTEQYGDLVAFLLTGFRTDTEGRPIQIDHPGHSDRAVEAFFEGRGSYHLLRTCNNWANQGLKKAGVRTALWAPLESSVRRHLPPATEGW